MGPLVWNQNTHRFISLHVYCSWLSGTAANMGSWQRKACRWWQFLCLVSVTITKNEMLLWCGAYDGSNKVNCCVLTCYFPSLQDYYTIQCHIQTNSLRDEINCLCILGPNTIEHAHGLLCLVFLWVYFRSWLIHVIHLPTSLKTSITTQQQTTTKRKPCA